MVPSTTIPILSYQQDFGSRADSALVLSHSFILLEPFQEFHESPGLGEPSDPTRTGAASGAKGQFWFGTPAGPGAREKLPILWPRAPCAFNVCHTAGPCPFPLPHGYCCIFQDPSLFPGENQGPLQRHHPWGICLPWARGSAAFLVHPQNGQNKSITSSCITFHLPPPSPFPAAPSISLLHIPPLQRLPSPVPIISPNSWLTHQSLLQSPQARIVLLGISARNRNGAGGDVSSSWTNAIH